MAQRFCTINPTVILSGAITSRSEVIAESKDRDGACSGTSASGNSVCTVLPAKQAAAGERLSAGVQMPAVQGSFDCVWSALRADHTALRMTGLLAGKMTALGREVMAVLGVAALLALSACRQDMHDQPRFKPLAQSDFYTDLRSARPPVEGTVARGQFHEDSYLYTGKIGPNPGGLMPFPVTDDVLARGRERFNIYCAPCHSRVGDGNGMVTQRGFKNPPSFHSERLRKVPLGYFFDVMTNGFGVMPDYASQIPPRDRWCIIAYIRALQLSQGATLADVPAGQKVPSQSVAIPEGEQPK